MRHAEITFTITEMDDGWYRVSRLNHSSNQLSEVDFISRIDALNMVSLWMDCPRLNELTEHTTEIKIEEAS